MQQICALQEHYKTHNGMVDYSVGLGCVFASEARASNETNRIASVPDTSSPVTFACVFVTYCLLLPCLCSCLNRFNVNEHHYHPRFLTMLDVSLPVTANNSSKL